MPNERLHYLFAGWLENSLSALEQDEFFKLVILPENHLLVESWVEKELISPKKELELPQPVTHSIISAILEADQDMPVKEVRSLHQWWKWTAAAVFLLLVSSTYFLMQYRSKRQPVVTNISHYSPKDIAPGKQGAILTLSNGKKVVLDSLGNGVIATQNGVQVILKSGQLAYDPSGKNNGEIVYNTMSTPKGRQFQVVLPDGTQVWLNSASSITYPTIFAGNQRTVRITGEVYFEVVKNARMPFKVKINNQAEVEVLGTHFNINAYLDENAVKTTLLEGSVKVTDKSDRAFLQPGQQAQVSSLDKIRIVKDVDTEKIMAWKKGLFNFEGEGLKEVMRQLSRWYDIDVVYEKQVPDMKFVGEMSKNISLSDLLLGLKGVGVHFRIEQSRRLVVLP